MLTACMYDSCNKHVLGLGQRIKNSLQAANLTGYQFGTVGVSDGISMGTFGMSYSLQSRDLIADQVETAAGGHWLDGMVTIPVSQGGGRPGARLLMQLYSGLRQEHVSCRDGREGQELTIVCRPGVLMALGRLNRPGLMGASYILSTSTMVLTVMRP